MPCQIVERGPCCSCMLSHVEFAGCGGFHSTGAGVRVHQHQRECCTRSTSALAQGVQVSRPACLQPKMLQPPWPTSWLPRAPWPGTQKLEGEREQHQDFAVSPWHFDLTRTRTATFQGCIALSVLDTSGLLCANSPSHMHIHQF